MGPNAVRRASWLVAAVLLAVCGQACSPSQGEARLRVDAAADALAILVGDPLWRVQREGLTGEQFVRRDLSRPRPTMDRTLLDPIVEVREVRGHIGSKSASVQGDVFLFDTTEAADRFRAASRKKVERWVAGSGGKARIREGAGADDVLPGFTLVGRPQEAGGANPVLMQLFLRGSVVVALQVHGVPELDEPAQDRVLAYVDRVLTVGKEAGEAPPSPRVFKDTPRTRIRVLDSAGRPVPYARAAVGSAVMLLSDADVRPGVAEFLSDGHAGFVRVWGAKDQTGRPLPLAPTSPVDISIPRPEHVIVLRPGVEIRGTVRDTEGQPETDVLVEALPAADGYQVLLDPVVHGEAHTRADGTFRIIGLATMAYRLRLSREGARLAAEGTQCMGGDDSVVVSLVKRAPLRLRVLDPQGRPVAGARVSLSPMDPTLDHIDATSDERGTLDLGGAGPGTSYRLHVMPPAARDDLAALDQDAWTPEAGDLRLAWGWTLRGKVLDEEGSPSAAEIYIRGDWLQAAAAAPDGTFTIPALAREPVEIVAKEQGGRHVLLTDDKSIPWVRVEPTSEIVTLHLSTAASADEPPDLRVSLLDPSGAPVERAQIRISPSGTHLGEFVDVEGGERRFARSGDDSLDVEVRAAWTKDGSPLAPARRLDVPPDQAGLAFRLEAGVSVSGVVRTADGTPAAGVGILAVRPEDFDEHGQLSENSKVAWGETGGNGTFRLVGLAHGPAILLLRTPPSLAPADPQRIEAPSSDVSVALPRGERLTILDWKGDPLADAYVEIHDGAAQFSWSPKAWVQTARTDEQGGFLHRTLDPSHPWALTIKPPPTREDLIAWFDEPWNSAEATIRLTRGLVLRGQVVDAKARPVPLIVVEVRLKGGSERDHSAASGMDGRFEVPNLPYGPLQVRAVGSGITEDRSLTDWVDVDPTHPEVKLVVAR